MTASDRLFKNQSNFLISNFREFYKLWRDNQEAILTVKCCDGKLSINFESSFQSPETKPTSQTIGIRKVKRISPSRRRRNQARAEQFRRNKASKDNADEIPASSKEVQEQMQVSVSSQESALEKPQSATPVPVDIDTRNLETLIKKTPIGDGPSDLPNDAEISLPASRVKRKAKRRNDKRKNATVKEKPVATVESSETPAAHVEAHALDDRSQRNDEPDPGSEELTPPKQWFTLGQLNGILDELEQRVKDDRDDPSLSDDLNMVSLNINNIGEFIGDEGGVGERILLSLKHKIQYLINYQKFQGTVQPRARASSVSSYKDRPSAKVSKKR